MATQVITRTLCDYCQHDDGVETPESDRVLITIGNDEYELDACPKHLKPVIDLKASLDEVARKVPHRHRRATKAATTSANADPVDGGIVCPECSVVLKNRGSLAAHVRDKHGKTLPELEGKPLTHECPTCGQRFASGGGLAAHSRVHSK